MKKRPDTDVAKDSAYSIFYRVLSMAFNYFYIAVAVRKLGSAKYGVWAVLLSIITWIEIFDLGIGNGLRNYLVKTINIKHLDEAKAAISTAYCILSVIGSIMLAAVWAVSLLIPWDRVLGYQEGDENLTGIVAIFFGFIIFNFVLSLCKSVLHALQKTRITYLMGVWLNMMNILSLFCMGQCSLLKMVISYGINLNLTSLLVSIYLYGIKCVEIKPAIRLYSRQYVPQVVNRGICFFVLQISSCIISWTDSLLGASYFGSEAVTPFSLINKVFMLPISLCLCVFTPLWSAFTRASATGDRQWMQKIVHRFDRGFPVIVAGLILLGTVTPFIIQVWTGVNIGNSNPLIISMIVFAALRIWCSFYAQLANGLDIMKSYLLLSVMQGVVNIPLSIILATKGKMGITGIVAGTNIVLSAGAVFIPRIVKKEIK